ncbi:MAG: glycosyltransferase [Thermodesulfobacteriota bacterium]
MIFVTVGNHYQGFDRLIKKVDEIASRSPYDVLIQKGYSTYCPQTVKYFDFVPIQAATDYIRKSELVISHAGIGTIILCRENGIPLLIFPRRKKYGEHGTDHQVEIAKALEERKDDNIFVVYEENQLENKIREILESPKRFVPSENIGKRNLVQVIRTFIEENG